MATYETSLSQRYGKRVGAGIHRQKQSAVAIVALTTAMIDNANDDCGLFYMPKGAVVTGATMSLTDCDSGTALVVDIGIAGTEALFISGATTGQAGGVTAALALAGHLYKFTADTQVRFYCNTAAGTPVAGTLKFELEFFMDEEFDTTALVAA